MEGRLRSIRLALPGSAEKETRSAPTFRLRDRIFVVARRGDGGHVSVRREAPPGSRAVLVGADPARFFVPPCVGHKGRVGVRLDDRPGRDEVGPLVGRGHRLIPPKWPATLAG